MLDTELVLQGVRFCVVMVEMAVFLREEMGKDEGNRLDLGNVLFKAILVDQAV